jgi:FAD/FMN-containing dehydrogenase/Fe-S oxidoreductase
MLPRLSPEYTLEKPYQDYLLALKNTTFSGDIRTDFAARLAVATDNSVYQVIPQAVILPKTTQDISIALQLCQQDPFSHIQFSPRGGGTGTNGQSLTKGIIIDCSQYMRDILEVNLVERWVRVQPGVVLDQLNVFLFTYGMHFAPEISPSNRATLGGMINTDACGNGSKVIGRTSDHVINLTCVLSDGRIIQTAEIHDENHYAKEIIGLLLPKKNLIQEKFRSRPRNLNGYNLLKTYTDKVNLNYLFCGSEGTLGIVGECKLKISPLPKFKKLVLVKYRCFDDALRSHDLLEKAKPLVVESIDEKLLDLAREDDIYFRLQDMLDGDVFSGAVNLVEFVAETEAELNHAIDILCSGIDAQSHAIGYYIAKDAAETKLLWELRKKSVGLISKRQQGTRRPIPFVEDTAVPPEKLADYICEFKKILDKHELIYGMYGHVDAGCVHVRPALDLKQIEDEKLFQEISNEVAQLVEQFGGVMWGEHGMGFRCHYAEHFFGEELYSVVRQIKTLFDPHCRLNPGKIASPFNHQQELVNLTEPLRAKFDKQIQAVIQHEYATTMACNGNGACFSYSTQETMCPSFKVTKDRLHSPKGRATVMREWLRELANKHVNIQSIKTAGFFRKIKNKFVKKDFSHEVYQAMNGCLSCKACTSQCPLNVDVPDIKSKFLEKYHQRYFRPLRDYLIASVESIALIQARFPRLMNLLLQNALTKVLMKKLFKLVDLPSVNGRLLSKLNDVSQVRYEDKEKSVILLQDAFTSFYETDLLLKVEKFFIQLGFTVYVLPFFPNGKSLHVKGFLKQFSRVARKNIEYLQKIAKIGIPMIGIEPSITLTYRDEYQKLMGNEKLTFNVFLLQEWLVEKADLLKAFQVQAKHFQYYLLSHCTEKTACVAAEKQWQQIFAALGLSLQPLAAGCCGMAGTYGHEVEHVQNSKTLFSLDWERYLNTIPESDKMLLVTGYSCRSQIKRLKGIKMQHPVELLLSIIFN